MVACVWLGFVSSLSANIWVCLLAVCYCILLDMFVLFCNDFLGGSAPGGLVTALSVDDSASHAGRSVLYAKTINSLLLQLFMSRLLRGQVFLLVRLEVAPCTGKPNFVFVSVFWFLFNIGFFYMYADPFNISVRYLAVTTVHGGLPQVLDNLQVSGSSFFYCLLVSCFGLLKPLRSDLCADLGC